MLSSFSGRQRRVCPKHSGVKIALVSITWEFAVGWLASELGADYAGGTVWKDDGTVSHFWLEDKANYLNSLLCELDLQRNALARGRGSTRVHMLNLASRSYFVGSHLPSELSHAKHWRDADIEEIVIDMLA